MGDCFAGVGHERSDAITLARLEPLKVDLHADFDTADKEKLAQTILFLLQLRSEDTFYFLDYQQV